MAPRHQEKDAKVKIILLYDDVIPDLNNEIVEFGISGLIKIDTSRICIERRSELFIVVSFGYPIF
jgi:hypothetical protein